MLQWGEIRLYVVLKSSTGKLEAFHFSFPPSWIFSHKRLRIKIRKAVRSEKSLSLWCPDHLGLYGSI